MLMKNPFTNDTIEYPVELLDLSIYEYHIRHETPFTECCREWYVTILDNDDMLYIPTGMNRCNKIYIVLDGYQARFPHGIYAISKNYFIR